jgi:hypothetical protein
MQHGTLYLASAIAMIAGVSLMRKAPAIGQLVRAVAAAALGIMAVGAALALFAVAAVGIR